MSLPTVVVWSPVSEATLVLRQNRIFPSGAATTMSVSQQLTMKIWPVRPFSGRPPSAGGLNRGSRQVPVHVGGSCGSITASACVSL